MFNLEKKGQTPLEIIGIAVVIVALLLMVFITTVNKNIETAQILTIGKNSIQCDAVASTIARLYNNRAITQETLNLETDTRLRRVEGNLGGINVGNISCSYIGSVSMDTGQKDSDPSGTGTTGITLVVGDWCFEKNPETNVVLTPEECI